MKRVDTQQYIKQIVDIVNEGKEVVLTITGSSMAPFLIHERDQVMLSPMKKSLKRGDIGLFRRTNGAYVVHRIYKVKKEQYYFLGDGQTVIEGPIKKDQIQAVVCAVKRKGVWITPTMWQWKVFQHVWIRLRYVRRGMSNIYAFIKVHKGGKR